MANPKAISSYSNSKLKTRQGIGELYRDPNDENSGVTDKDQQKAEILSRFYNSVFTREPGGQVPELAMKKIVHQMEELKITESGIKKIFNELKPNKSPGPDKFNQAFLKMQHKASQYHCRLSSTNHWKMEPYH